MASKKVTLYFVGTRYKKPPIFSVRGTLYSPKKLGDAVMVRENDVEDLIKKARVDDNGRSYEGFTKDPTLAAAIVEQAKNNVLKGVPVAGSLADSLALASQTDLLNALGNMPTDVIRRILLEREGAGYVAPSIEEPQKESVVVGPFAAENEIFTEESFEESTEKKSGRPKKTN